MKQKTDEKIKKIIQAVGKIEPGVTHIAIEHDEDCPALKTHNLKDCNCQPDIKRMS